jgi:hypothetical protein
MIFPLLLLDSFVFLYQLICFPVYGIPKVRRSDYQIFDHQDLAYLNLLEKINYAYRNELKSIRSDFGCDEKEEKS